MSRPAGVSPTREQFLALADTARVIPVVRTVLADGLTPLGLHRRLADSRPGTFLMESAAPGAAWSRYSFVGAGSAVTLTARGSEAVWQGTPPEGLPTTGDALEVLAESLRLLATDARAHVGPDLPHLVSGFVGFLGWPVVRSWERLPHPPQDDLGLPALALNLVTDLAVHDALDGTVTLVANAVNANGLSTGAEQAYDDAVARLDAMVASLRSGVEDPVDEVPSHWFEASAEDIAAQAEDRWGAAGFRAAVAQAQQAIRDGEVFQAVVSRRLSVPTPVSGVDVYRVLRMVNPSPYMYLFSFETPEGEPYEIVGSSPEALVTVEGRRVVTHPIAGSRRRGATAEDDALLGKELAADEKERAEHLMLVDLARNDLSRVSEAGSVEVTQFMELEAFSHILHLVSHVEARLREDVTALDALRAAFPAGTLSGAPKPRALQLLDEWEPTDRGPYGGVVGYFDLAGDMDMAINIRSVTLAGGRAHVQAGAGIVADSNPEAEAAETVTKATAPLRAVLAATAMQEL
ncbi:chorismate-binding protein [Micrococcus sp.]|uniref:chorismate-binding protein n=1 Tax=Micrococcus sp. TaxID=1271 RepID=UPI002A91CC17|nr:chorismate-binding protein [Micrococcus sp.]MDY6054417.1 chorismate-binding protein [Micrococcus sp.]